VFELAIEIIPLSPTRHGTAAPGWSAIGVTAAIIWIGARETVPLVKMLQDRARPPVEMGTVALTLAV
jgi:hypothetical protein